MSSGSARKFVLGFIGKTTASSVKQINGGPWEQNLVNMTYAAKETFPAAAAVRLHGAKAHQSHTNPEHAKVLSFSIVDRKKNRIASGHLHENGDVDWAVAKEKEKDKGKLKTKGQGSGSGSGSRSQPGQDLQWQFDSENLTQAVWWDGDQWQNGSYNEGDGLWYAYYEGEWVPWQ